MFLEKAFLVFAIAIGILCSLGAVSAYAVTYTYNAFGYSDATSYIDITATKYVDHYTGYPEYYSPTYGAYYYGGSYYYYPSPAVYYVTPYYPTYTVITTYPVYTNTYYRQGWYYS